jgi:hypothetical protein
VRRHPSYPRYCGLLVEGHLFTSVSSYPQEPGSRRNLDILSSRWARLEGDLGRVGECQRQALAIARAIASSWDEAHALAGLGRRAIVLGDCARGEKYLRVAHAVFLGMGAADAGSLNDEVCALGRGRDPAMPAGNPSL